MKLVAASAVVFALALPASAQTTGGVPAATGPTFPDQEAVEAAPQEQAALPPPVAAARTLDRLDKVPGKSSVAEAPPAHPAVLQQSGPPAGGTDGQH